MQNKAQNRINNRGGRTSSTTTVFQKLDSRSHLTTQKNPLNDEGEDHYMVMLNGGDENIQALLLNREQQEKEGSVSAKRATEGRNQDDNDFSGVISADNNKGKMSFDAGRINRPQTTVIAAKKDWPYSSQSALGHDSESIIPVAGTQSHAYGAAGTPFEDQESSFF